MRDRNLTIDTLRLLAALEVVILHVALNAVPDWLAIGLRLQARWAVPYFFLIGGYFIGKRLFTQAGYDGRPALFRLLWLFGLWSILSIPEILLTHGPKEVFRRLLYPSFLYYGTSFHLWFLSSMVLAILVILFCFHYKLERFLPFASGLIFLHVLMAGSYDVFDIKFPFEFETARHWTSIPFMYMGILLARRGPPPAWAAWAMIIGGLGLEATEAWVLYEVYGASPLNHEIVLGTIPLAFGTAGLGLRGVRVLESNLLADWGRWYSLGIYLAHPIIAGLLVIMFRLLQLPTISEPVAQLLYPVLIFLVSLSFFVLVRRGSGNVFAWLLGQQIEKA